MTALVLRPAGRSCGGCLPTSHAALTAAANASWSNPVVASSRPRRPGRVRDEAHGQVPVRSSSPRGSSRLSCNRRAKVASLRAEARSMNSGRPVRHTTSGSATARPGDLLQKQSQQPMCRHAPAGRTVHPANCERLDTPQQVGQRRLTTCCKTNVICQLRAAAPTTTPRCQAHRARCAPAHRDQQAVVERAGQRSPRAARTAPLRVRSLRRG